MPRRKEGRKGKNKRRGHKSPSDNNPNHHSFPANDCDAENPSLSTNESNQTPGTKGVRGKSDNEKQGVENSTDNGCRTSDVVAAALRQHSTEKHPENTTSCTSASACLRNCKDRVRGHNKENYPPRPKEFHSSNDCNMKYYDNKCQKNSPSKSKSSNGKRKQNKTRRSNDQTVEAESETLSNMPFTSESMMCEKVMDNPSKTCQLKSDIATVVAITPRTKSDMPSKISALSKDISTLSDLGKAEPDISLELSPSPPNISKSSTSTELNKELPLIPALPSLKEETSNSLNHSSFRTKSFNISVSEQNDSTNTFHTCVSQLSNVPVSADRTQSPSNELFFSFDMPDTKTSLDDCNEPIVNTICLTHMSLSPIASDTSNVSYKTCFTQLESSTADRNPNLEEVENYIAELNLSQSQSEKNSEIDCFIVNKQQTIPKCSTPLVCSTPIQSDNSLADSPVTDLCDSPILNNSDEKQIQAEENSVSEKMCLAQQNQNIYSHKENLPPSEDSGDFSEADSEFSFSGPYRSHNGSIPGIGNSFDYSFASTLSSNSSHPIDQRQLDSSFNPCIGLAAQKYNSPSKNEQDEQNKSSKDSFNHFEINNNSKDTSEAQTKDMINDNLGNRTYTIQRYDSSFSSNSSQSEDQSQFESSFNPFLGLSAPIYDVRNNNDEGEQNKSSNESCIPSDIHNNSQNSNLAQINGALAESSDSANMPTPNDPTSLRHAPFYITPDTVNFINAHESRQLYRDTERGRGQLNQIEGRAHTFTPIALDVPTSNQNFYSLLPGMTCSTNFLNRQESVQRYDTILDSNGPYSTDHRQLNYSLSQASGITAQVSRLPNTNQQTHQGTSSNDNFIQRATGQDHVNEIYRNEENGEEEVEMNPNDWTLEKRDIDVFYAEKARIRQNILKDRKQLNSNLRVHRKIMMTWEKPSRKMKCHFCINRKEDPIIYKSHELRDRNRRIICPMLLEHKCPKCEVKGHTIKYCPQESTFDTLEGVMDYYLMTDEEKAIYDATPPKLIRRSEIK